MKAAGEENHKTILFISSNDGSDMRINKEIRSLNSAGFAVVFVGVESSAENCFVKLFCKEVFLVKGPRNSPSSLLRMLLTVIQILLTRRISSIHIINEQLMIFFYPLLFFKHTVLDIFDSVFLKMNRPGDSLKLLKWLVYLPVNRILVTDERRLGLMPRFALNRCRVLPNYPSMRSAVPRQIRTRKLCILYNGWMGRNRGTEIIEGLIQTGLPVNIIMAGWFSDAYTQTLVSKYPESIDFRGVVKQETALNWSENEADYILCVYAPINENNINASPNKIYDAIHTGTPVIVNREVRISGFAEEHKIGFILPQYDCLDYSALFHQLIERRNSFHWSDELKTAYSWENTEKILIQSHRPS
jgi:hypothetical protein